MRYQRFHPLSFCPPPYLESRQSPVPASEYAVFCPPRIWNQGKAPHAFSRPLNSAPPVFGIKAKRQCDAWPLGHDSAPPVFGIKAKQKAPAPEVSLDSAPPYLESRQSRRIISDLKNGRFCPPRIWNQGKAGTK